MITLSSIPVSFAHRAIFILRYTISYMRFPFSYVTYLKTFTGFSGEDDNSSDAGLTKEERKEKYR